MESTGVKRQTLAEDNMDTTENSYFESELRQRRRHLLAASLRNTSDTSLRLFLNSVDAARN